MERYNLLAEMFPKTKEYLLVRKHFKNEFRSDCPDIHLKELLFKGKEAELLKIATELEKKEEEAKKGKAV